MIEEEYKYYKEHQDELVNLYNDKYITIKDNAVIGVYNSDIEAYKESIKLNPLGTFIIMHCIPGIESYTQTFHSRVVFS